MMLTKMQYREIIRQAKTLIQHLGYDLSKDWAASGPRSQRKYRDQKIEILSKSDSTAEFSGINRLEIYVRLPTGTVKVFNAKGHTNTIKVCRNGLWRKHLHTEHAKVVALLCDRSSAFDPIDDTEVFPEYIEEEQCIC